MAVGIGIFWLRGRSGVTAPPPGPAVPPVTYENEDAGEMAAGGSILWNDGEAMSWNDGESMSWNEEG